MWAPELKERKLSQFLLQRKAQIPRAGIDIGYLATIRRIERSWRYRVISRRIHIEPPAKVGAGKVWIKCTCHLPDLRTLDKGVGLPPELHLALIAKIPAIAHNAMLIGSTTRQKSGLNGAGHGR